MTAQQRREARQRILQARSFTRIPHSRVGVPIKVGNRIPRRLRTYVFTSALLALIPAYAGYRYLVVDDEICIVEPTSYEIVDVIPATLIEDPIAQTPPAAVIQLSSSQSRCVVDAVPHDRARAELEFSLSPNSVVPLSVELVPLPQDAVRCAAPLDGYRYVVVEDRVVIVEPAERRIVLTLQL